MAATHYETLGVEPGCGTEELRRAYRTLVRALHPDATGEERPDHRRLTDLNRAWRVLSDVSQRARYDESLVTAATTRRPHLVVVSPPPAPQTTHYRREEWVQGVRAQIVRLSSQSGKSATQTLLLRNPRGGRDAYASIVAIIVDLIAMDTEARVRAARAAGAAPLDLGVAATLIGIRSAADEIRRLASEGVSLEYMMAAELLDRMWDVLAHELPVSLAAALGGNPNVARKVHEQAS
ncbi:MAG: J domain-containing protein [Acidimicrobiales bacterium]|nr:J domain-containing protein [Acidimicrobiales bacterium]